jgi:hypothetical protein
MPLYSMIAEHDGATCISQHRARTVGLALAKWVQDDNSSGPVHRRRRSTKERLERDLLDAENNKLTAVDGCVRVWCTCAIVRGKLLLLDIVETKA